MAEAGSPAPDAGDGLTGLSRAFTYARSLDEVLSLAVDRAAELMEAPRALVMLMDDEGLLRIRAARGVDDEVVERFREPLDETLVRRLSGLLGPDARDGFLGVPLVVQGVVTGLLAVLRDRSGPVTEQEERILSAVADQAAVALGSARLERRAAALATRVAELERERSSRDHALQVVSHDLRSPLNAVHGYVHLLRSDILGEVNERQKETLGRIQKVLEHLEALVEDVLEATRPEDEQARPLSRVRVGQVVEDSLAVTGPAAEEADIDVVVDVPPDACVRAHGDRLRQVLVHLVDNAVKYAPRGSAVRIRCGSADVAGAAACAIKVSDNGPGIPPERQEDIFRPYERLAPAENDRARSGVGLGLAIARNLVRRMDGELTVESTPGEGATFVVRLVAAGEPEDMEEPRAAEESEARLGREGRHP